jgi:hypothetical protein
VFAWSGNGSDPTVSTNNGSNIRIDGISFAARTTGEYGGELNVTGSNIVVSNNTFTGGSSTNVESGGVNGAKIMFNTINSAGDIGLLMFGPKNTRVDCNSFTNNNEQLHLFWGASGPSNPDNVTVDHNQFHHTHRYVMELQGGPNTVEVAHNWTGDWADADFQSDCLSTTFSIATGGSGTGTTSYHVKVHDNVMGAPPSDAKSHIGSGCGGIGSPYELMGSDLEGYNNHEWGQWDGGPLTGWTTSAWRWHDNVKYGSDVTTYPGAAGEAGYQAPAAGNYVDNSCKAASAATFPAASWAATDDATP